MVQWEVVKAKPAKISSQQYIIDPKHTYMESRKLHLKGTRRCPYEQTITGQTRQHSSPGTQGPKQSQPAPQPHNAWPNEPPHHTEKQQNDYFYFNNYSKYNKSSNKYYKCEDNTMAGGAGHLLQGHQQQRATMSTSCTK